MLRQDGGADALEEERRLFYVGTTRARKKLHILNARVRTRFGIRDACIPSRFLDEMDMEAVVFELGAPRKAFSGGDLEMDDSPRRPLGPSGLGRRPAFPPGSLRSVDRPGAAQRFTSGPSMGTPGRAAASAFPEYESENQSLENAYKAGMQVKHPKFGNGKVVKIHGSGTAARLDVQFGKETKRLVASMANLTILG
jgi:DNA helicase-2/ATP-dependent DNA helicase PcrA